MSWLSYELSKSTYTHTNFTYLFFSISLCVDLRRQKKTHEKMRAHIITEAVIEQGEISPLCAPSLQSKALLQGSERERETQCVREGERKKGGCVGVYEQSEHLTK